MPVSECSEGDTRGIRKEENREGGRVHFGEKLEIYHVFGILFASKVFSVLLSQGYISHLAFLKSSHLTVRGKCSAGDECKELHPLGFGGRLS